MEELRKYLEEKKKEYTDLMNIYFHPHKAIEYAMKAEAYQEIIDYIDNVKNK